MSDIDELKTAIQRHWSRPPSAKAKRYIEQFWDRTRRGRKIMAKVEGNHGTYKITIEAKGKEIIAACSCYIGGQGGCHHCMALALTFLNTPTSFSPVDAIRLEDVTTLDELKGYLNGITLDELVKQMRAKGITQKAFAESIGMSSRHLSAIKSSELRNRYFHELGATKLACLWVVSNLANKQ